MPYDIIPTYILYFAFYIFLGNFLYIIPIDWLLEHKPLSHKLGTKSALLLWIIWPVAFLGIASYIMYYYISRAIGGKLMSETVYYVGYIENGDVFDTKEEAIKFAEECLVEELFSIEPQLLTKKYAQKLVNNFFYITKATKINIDVDKCLETIKSAIKEEEEAKQIKENKEKYELYLKLKEEFEGKDG